MKNFLNKLCITAFVMSAVCMTSCNQEEGISPKGPAQDEVSLDSRSGNPTVSGHVELDIPDLEFNYYNIFEKYSFTAVMHQDGSVSGEFNVYDNYYPYENRIVAHGNVTCFTIQPDGKTAWLGGIIEHGSITFDGVVYDQTGLEANWIVVDNGQGANAPADEASDLTFGFENAATNNCENGDSFNFFYGPILRGNVKVKP